MTTGDATTIRLRRERVEVERLIRVNALNNTAVDRYNQLSHLLRILGKGTAMSTAPIEIIPDCDDPSLPSYRKGHRCEGCKAAVRVYRDELKQRAGQTAPAVRTRKELERDVVAQVTAPVPAAACPRCGGDHRTPDELAGDAAQVATCPPSTPASDRVVVDARALRDALAPFAKVVSRRAHLPVLGCVKLLTAGDSLILQGTDLEVTLEARVPVEPGPAELNVVVPADALTAAVKAMVPKRAKDAASVELHVDEPGRLLVASGFQRQTLHLLAVEDFPTVATLNAKAGRELDGATFARLVAQIHPAVGDEQARPALNAALLEIGRDRLTVAATDSYRLAVRNLPYSGGRQTFRNDAAMLVQREAFKLAGQLFAKAPTLRVSWEAKPASQQPTALAFCDDTRTLLIRPVEGEFPNFRNLIPDLSGGDYGALEVERQQLVDALNSVPHSKQQTQNPVHLLLREDELELSASEQDVATTTMTLPARWNGEVGTRVAFNPGFLRDGLAGFTGPTIIWIRDGLKPAMVQCADAAQGDLYLLMPVRLP
jgi:DNA polymerase III subunit beta